MNPLPLPARTSMQPTGTSIPVTLRLADFILANRNLILSEWEAFAKTCAPASGSMGIAALSDHASEMLTVIARDLQTLQGDLEQSAKSKGLAPSPTSTEQTAAEQHGPCRAERSEDRRVVKWC